MRTGFWKGIVAVLTAAMIAATAFFAAKELAGEEGAAVFSVRVISPAGTEEVACWDGGDGELYVFLPSYAGTDQAQIHLHRPGTNLQLDGKPLSEGMSCGEFALDTPYSLVTDGEDSSRTLTFVRSADVPAMYIDVRSGSMDYIHQSADNSETGQARIYDDRGELTWAGELQSIHGRGYSTWDSAKKPYSLELTIPADLLGMGEAAKWVLLANSYDASQLRNKLAYDFAREAGLEYSPQCRWVDLYLNGEYAGLYLLSERNEVHSQRVDLSPSGSFLVSKNWQWRLDSRKREYFTTAGNAALRLHEYSMPREQVESIWQSAENGILAQDGIDPVTGRHYQDLIDLDSWVRKFLVEEIFANADAGVLSQFFYYDGGDSTGKIYAGPVWDYDLSLGNPISWPTQTPQMLYAARTDVWGSPWYGALYQKEAFYQRLRELYEQELQPLLARFLEERLSQYRELISQAARMNQLRWPEADAAADARYIETYLAQRMEFLNSLWIREEPYYLVRLQGLDGARLWYCVAPGDSLPSLPEYEDTDTTDYLGWYHQESGEPVSETETVHSDLILVLKVENREAPPAADSQEEAVTEDPDLASLLWLWPLGIFLAVFLGVIAVDMVLRRKERKRSHAPTERKTLSS